MHVFPYSKRAGTPAATMEGQLDASVKKDRVARLCAVGKEIRRELLSQFVSDNETATILFEDYKDGFAYGHTGNFIEVRVPSPRSLHSEVKEVKLISSNGDFIDARLTD